MRSAMGTSRNTAAVLWNQTLTLNPISHTAFIFRILRIALRILLFTRTHASAVSQTIIVRTTIFCDLIQFL